MAVDATTPEPGLRERKKQQTREAIAAAALELFLEHGFAATTLKQVAEAANVAPRTVSLYFPAKEQLVFAVYDELMLGLKTRLEARRPGESAADALRAFLRDYTRQAVQHDLERSRRVRALIESEPALRAFERATQERAERTVAQAVAADLGVPADELLPHMAGAATVAALDALGRRVMDGEAAFAAEADALVDEAIAFIAAGVRELAGRRGR